MSSSFFYYTSVGDIPFPPVPTRDELCNVLCSLQGMNVNTQQYGNLFWWDPYIGQLDLIDDRMEAYRIKHAAGNTHINITLDKTGLACLPKIHALCEEAIRNGFFVMLSCMGDGCKTDFPRNYDPNALGYEWLMSNFQAIYDYMYDLANYIVFVPGYDGIVPGWQPFTFVNNFINKARSIIDIGGRGMLGMYLSAGYWCWSGETNDWDTDDGKKVDVIFQELPYQIGPPDLIPSKYLDQNGWKSTTTDQERVPWDQVWQIIGHMISPFLRPLDMPANDYPSGLPYVLGKGTPRGRFYYCIIEYDTYGWVYYHVPIDQINKHYTAIRTLGNDLLVCR